MKLLSMLSTMILCGTVLTGCSQTTSNTSHESEQRPITQKQKKGYCIDVTSYDNNRQNDMKCTRSDGSIFYTDYAGARAFEDQ